MSPESPESPEAAAAAYIRFFETLSPETLAGLDALCTADVRFRDPFNDVRGVDAFRGILGRMFRELREPRFTVLDHAVSGRVCYLRWDFAFRRGAGRGAPRGAPLRIEGMSEVHFDADGKVAAHLDHWDAGQVYELVPLAGALVRFVRRRLAGP